MTRVIRWMSGAFKLVGGLGCIAVVAYAFGLFNRSEPIRVGQASPDAGRRNACELGQKTGAADIADDVRTADGLAIRVRTPANYDATRAYPLLVAYPPAGMDRATAERYYGLTPEATARGYIVAYSDHVRLSRQAIWMQADVAPTVMRSWCVDPDAVFFLGHSDGGSIAASGLIFPETGAVIPRAIVSSGAGIQATDLRDLRQRGPLRLRIVHSRDDERFPGFGRGVARVFATIEACDLQLPRPDQAGCATYQGCREGSRIDYCETTGPHAQWRRNVAASFEFLDPRP